MTTTKTTNMTATITTVKEGSQLKKVFIKVDNTTGAGTGCNVNFKLRDPATQESCQTKVLNSDAKTICPIHHGALHCEVIDSWEPGDAVEFSNESKELAPCNDFHLIGDHLQFNFIVDCIDQLRLQFVSFLFGDKLFQRWDSNQRFFSWNNDRWSNETCFFCSN